MSFLHNLIHFLLFFNHLRLPTPETRHIISLSCLGRAPQKTSLPLLLRVDSLLQRYVYRSAARFTDNTALLLWRAFVLEGMFLPSRCLTMNYSEFQTSCQNSCLIIDHNCWRLFCSFYTLTYFVSNSNNIIWCVRSDSLNEYQSAAVVLKYIEQKISLHEVSSITQYKLVQLP
jgi:hypothetical protein